jgi:hypothetical protein
MTTTTQLLGPSCDQPLAEPSKPLGARTPCNAHEQFDQGWDHFVLIWGPANWNGGRRASCIHCGGPSLLIDDQGRPAHKACVEAKLAALVARR